jgi:hypothetical protein
MTNNEDNVLEILTISLLNRLERQGTEFVSNFGKGCNSISATSFHHNPQRLDAQSPHMLIHTFIHNNLIHLTGRLIVLKWLRPTIS